MKIRFWLTLVLAIGLLLGAARSLVIRKAYLERADYGAWLYEDYRDGAGFICHNDKWQDGAGRTRPEWWTYCDQIAHWGAMIEAKYRRAANLPFLSVLPDPPFPQPPAFAQ